MLSSQIPHPFNSNSIALTDNYSRIFDDSLDCTKGCQSQIENELKFKRIQSRQHGTHGKAVNNNIIIEKRDQAIFRSHHTRLYIHKRTFRLKLMPKPKLKSKMKTILLAK